MQLQIKKMKLMNEMHMPFHIRADIKINQDIKEMFHSHSIFDSFMSSNDDEHTKLYENSNNHVC
jgi:hypothetical protein